MPVDGSRRIPHGGLLRDAARLLAVGLLAMFSAIPAANANGFAIDEQDPSSLATVLAGRAARADGPNTVFYNPAGMARLKQTEAAGSLIYIRTTGEFSDRGSSLGTTPLSGGEGGDPGRDSFIPALYIVTPIEERWRFGFALNVPFGLSTKYDRGWVGRYHALSSKLTVINLNPAVSYRIDDWLSVGAGMSAQYLDAELTRAIDLGSLLGVPQGADGRSRLTGTDWAIGYNFGVLLELAPGLRLGASYRSRVRHDVEGKARFDLPPAAAPLAALGLFADTSADTRVTLPENASLSAYLTVVDGWALLADLTYTRWSRNEKLAITFNNPLQPAISEAEDWNDTVRVALGLVHSPSPRWRLQAGVAFDPTPIPDDRQRPRLAAGDRILVGAGISYRLDQWVSVDLAYMHSFSERVNVDITEPGAGRLVGRFGNMSADLFSLGGSIRF